MTTVEVTQADVTRELDRAIDRIMSIEIEAMGGDNLAVSLCSYFDRDDDSEPDDNGWSQSATDAYDEIKKEIAGLFVPVREKLTAFARYRIAATPPDALQTVVEAWLPIESAPRDGTRFLAWCPYVGRAIMRIHGLHRETWAIDPSGKFGCQPTHWMPLPTPPEPRETEL